MCSACLWMRALQEREEFMELEVKLEAFEGPLDLLLHLIEKNKVSIYDIPIAEITEQYLAYVSAMQQENLDVVSEFLVMAATLLDIKSRMLLPKEEKEEEEDPREELVERLLEYKLYKTMAAELREWQEDAEMRFYKTATIPKEVSAYEEPVDVQALFAPVTLERLQMLYEQALKRREDRLDPIRSKFGTIRQEPIKVSDKIRSVQRMGRKKKKFSFSTLLEEQKSRMAVVVTFLAVLELMKVGQITAIQEETFGDIEMEWNEAAADALTEQDLEQYDG